MSGTIDEARLETRCIRAIQAVDRGDHSVARPGAASYRTSDAVVLAMGWMYMDLERAVRELETVAAQQLDDGSIPDRVGREGAVLPLLASVFRMVYHAARGRQRRLEPRLGALVPTFDRFHQWLARGDHQRLRLFQPGDAELLPRSAAPIQDVGRNALLVQADSDLADVAIHTGHPIRGMVARRTHRALALARRLWRDELRAFASRDAGGAWRPLAADDLLPLWSGAAPRYQARALLELHLGQEREGQGFWSVWPLATLPQDAPGYAPETRGQGAVDPLLNWLMVRGLYRYGADDQARELAEATVRLAARHGLAPAYDATTGHPVGPEAEPDWAPTAALVLDLLKTPPDYDRW